MTRHRCGCSSQKTHDTCKKIKKDCECILEVENLASVTALDDKKLSDGQKAIPGTICQPYALSKDSDADVDGITVLATLSGVGRWLRTLVAVAKWTYKKAWGLDSVDGNDENSGDDEDGKRLKHAAEFCRRVIRGRLPGADITYDVHATNDIAEDDAWMPNMAIDPVFTDGRVFVVQLRGDRKSVLSSTTGSGSADSDPSAGVNEPPLFDGGAFFHPPDHIGSLIVLADGTTAWILAARPDKGDHIAAVSQYAILTPRTTGSASTSIQSAPGNGVSYDIVELTKFNCPFVSVGTPIMRYQFIDLDFTPNTSNESLTFKSVAFSLVTCRMSRRAGHQGANGTYFGCGLVFSSLTTIAFFAGCDVAVSTSGLLNVELVSADGSTVLPTNSVSYGGYLAHLTAQSSPAFGGLFGAAGQTPGQFVVRGSSSAASNKGFGIFNSPTSGVVMRGGKTATLRVNNAPLYGQRNADYGVDVREGASINARTIVPTIKGDTAEILLQDGDDIPSVGAGGTPVAGVPVTTWVQWDGAPYTRNAMSLKTGAAIVDSTTS